MLPERKGGGGGRGVGSTGTPFDKSFNHFSFCEIAWIKPDQKKNDRLYQENTYNHIHWRQT